MTEPVIHPPNKGSRAVAGTGIPEGVEMSVPYTEFLARQSARQAIASRRSGPSHRSRQAQLRRVQLGGVSNPSGSRAVSRGWYVR